MLPLEIFWRKLPRGEGFSAVKKKSYGEKEGSEENDRA